MRRITPATCLECEGRCWVSVDLSDRSDVVSHTGFVKCPACGGSGREPEAESLTDTSAQSEGSGA